MAEHTLHGFWLEHMSYGNQFFCELEESGHKKALLFYFNGDCRSVDLTGRESLFVDDLIDCDVNNWKREYHGLDMETTYPTGWYAEISYDDQWITSGGRFNFPESWEAFRHCMNKWMYKNGGITVYTWDSIQNSFPAECNENV